jgi:hypothetical protein
MRFWEISNETHIMHRHDFAIAFEHAILLWEGEGYNVRKETNLTNYF